jgi:glycogen(starch) synthase
MPRIAFISFEYPPSVAIGGIGTYVWEASRMLAQAGVSVEVFAAGAPGPEPAESFGVLVHRTSCIDRHTFRHAVLPQFIARHHDNPFDLIESPDISAEGACIAARFPELAIVVKLHTPSYLCGVIGHDPPTLLDRARFRLGALRRGRWQGLPVQPYVRAEDPDYLFTHQAHGIDAPSQAIADRLKTDWDLDDQRISVFPYPFSPQPDFLALPVTQQIKTIGFLGRLEARKGVVELARALPAILRARPELSVRFIGPTWPYLRTDMESWIRRHCHAFLDRITFVGAVARNGIAEELSRCDLMVFPSRWESFGLVCPEAMAAGRIVIGSSAGGMAEVIEHGISGLLVEPSNPKAIESAVLSLAAQPDLVAKLGAAGRKRVLDYLSPKRILPLQLNSYERALQRVQQRRV